MTTLDEILDEADLSVDIADLGLDQQQLMLLASLGRLIRQQGAQTMASLDNITAAIAKLDTDVEQAASDVAAALQALKDQIGGLTAGAISQEQIDALQAGVDSADAAVTALDQSVAPTV